MPHRTQIVRWLLGIVVAGLAFSSQDLLQAEELQLTLRSRSPMVTEKGLPGNQVALATGRHHIQLNSATWNPRETAVVVCDMWDTHTCPKAAQRVAEMAPRLNELLKKLRQQGVLIIHAPSDTMPFYEDHPGRTLARSAPVVAPPKPIQHWSPLHPMKEAPLPIDDSDGGCDCETIWKKGDPYPWTRQIAAIEIADGDAITDSAEAYNLLKARGIKHLLVTGVHTNMCVLGRPFSIRQMVGQGFDVALVRDLTDSLYNPAKAPYVSHFTGTDLVVEHIEKYWCPTVTSDQFLGGEEFRFKDDRRPHVVMLIGEPEYQTASTLPPFALEHLGKEFRVTILHLDETSQDHFPGIGHVKQADVLLISVRRHPLQPKDMEIIRGYIAAGRPVVGIRTASHAFSLRNKPAPAGTLDWPSFDAEVFGGSYTNHYGAQLKTTAQVVEKVADHPIVRGLPTAAFATGGSLYQVLPLANGSQVLLMGNAETIDQPEPVAWLFTRKDGGTSFYTSLGHADDFKGKEFPQLLKQAIAELANLPLIKTKASDTHFNLK